MFTSPSLIKKRRTPVTAENFDLDYTIIIRGKLPFLSREARQACIDAGHMMDKCHPALHTRTSAEVELTSADPSAYLKTSKVYMHPNQGPAISD